MTSVNTTRTSVIQRAKNGDAADFARLYGPLAYAVARKRGVSQPDAEDLMQQAMLELLTLLPKFEYDRSRGSFKGLVRKVVVNRVADLLKRRRPVADDGVMEGAPDSADLPDAVFEREWQKAHLQAALDSIRSEVKPTTFQSFQLTVLSEWPVEDAARTLGLTPNQVYQNKRRVIQRLRERMKELTREAEPV